MKINEILNKFKEVIKKLKVFGKNRFLIILGSVFFIFFVYISITYNSKLKREKSEAIDSFLLNNDTILLKNYFLNQIKSPYLEYDYLIKDGDTIETIFKKFSIKDDQVDFIVKKIKKNEFGRYKNWSKNKFFIEEKC